MKYVVQIEETLAKHVIVEAKNPDEAVNIAESAYQNGNIQLDYDDFCNTDIRWAGVADEEDIKWYEEVNNG